MMVQYYMLPRFFEGSTIYIAQDPCSAPEAAGRGGHAGVESDICGTTQEEDLIISIAKRVISAREGDTRYITLPRTIETATKG